MMDMMHQDLKWYDKVLLADKWLFSLEEMPDAWMKGAPEDCFCKVVVPHDWSVTLPFSEGNSSGTGYVSGGTGWYRRHFVLDSAWRSALAEGGRVQVCFDGVYKHARVWVNGYYKGFHANGYTPFQMDITDDLDPDGDNVLVVSVEHTDLADSRWFTGSGLVRKVYLTLRAPFHVDTYGSFLHTKRICPDGSAEVEVHVPLVNDSSCPAAASVRCQLLEVPVSDPEQDPREAGIGIVGHSDEVSEFQRDAAAVMEGSITAAPGQSAEMALHANLPAARLWSPESPRLYELVTEIRPDPAPAPDAWYLSDRRRVGIRVTEFDPDQGFRINGRSCKLRGLCLHEDCGALGSAALKQVWYRRLTFLKEAGCNAIRMSHNPHMEELYDLCDELGFFVMDEAFDEWEGPKNKWSHGHNVYPPRHEGYWLDFPTSHRQDLKDMILRDRAHASVILWSIGNEIDYPNDPYCHPSFQSMTGNNDAGKPAAERQYDPSRPNAERLPKLAAMLAAQVREIDTTHPVTLAAAFPELSAGLGFLDALDVAGYNYKEHLYAKSHADFPRLPFLGSENSHRFEDWKVVRDCAYISGQFLWTGIDYLGEAHGWPIRAAGSGILDLAGFPKSGYYRRQSFWSSRPMAHVSARVHNEGLEDWQNEYLDSWNAAPGTPMDVVCYTNLSQAELWLNGERLDVQERSDEEDGIHWTIPYASGTLTVIASGPLTARPDGRPLMSGQDAKSDPQDGTAAPVYQLESSLKTSLSAASLSLRAFHTPAEYVQEGPGLLQAEVLVVDSEQSPVVTGSYPVTIQVSGGQLVCMESGDTADCTIYTSSTRMTCRGHLLALIRPLEDGGPVTVSASCPGLTGDEIVIPS